MKCPFLEEVVMKYCKAYPVKKMIPASGSQMISSCETKGFSTCPIYREVKGDKTCSPAIEPPKKISAQSLASLSRERSGAESQPIKSGTEVGEQKYCIWLRQEVVSYRLCTKNYDCKNCAFEQQLMEQDGKYIESPEVLRAIETQMKKLPASQRRCKYMVTGKTLYEPCTHNYQCWDCPTYLRIKESIISTYVSEAQKK